MRKIKWWLTSHLIWKRGNTWNKYLETIGVYCEACPNNKFYSAYDFWKNYSPINGR